MPEGSPSVLIIRLDAIGDALALTPLLAALRRRAVPVDIVLRPMNAGIFASRAARRIICADFELRSSTRSNLAAIERLGHELRLHEYSHVLVATEDPGGYRLASAIGAAARVGFGDARGKPLKALWTRRLLTATIYRSSGLDPNGPHECDVLFRLGEPLLGSEQPTREVAQLRPLVLEREPRPDDRIAIQITDKWARLGIDVAEVVELIRRVSAFGTLHLIGAPTEASYGDAIARATGLTVSYFQELEPWKASIAAAAALLAPDSGAMHVAGMTGTPVVAVFPSQRAFTLQIARWAPWAAPHRIICSDEGWPLRASDALAELLAA
jgi:ADP-heptose:LPS heptosyltransferase